jgi:hypothetical protein
MTPVSFLSLLVKMLWVPMTVAVVFHNQLPWTRSHWPSTRRRARAYAYASRHDSDFSSFFLMASLLHAAIPFILAIPSPDRWEKL